MPGKLPPVIDGIPAYTGAAVYALYDEHGRPYIGSTNNLQTRLKAHSYSIRQLQREGVCTFGSRKLQKAVLGGRRFHVEVLQAFPDGASHKELVNAERAFFIAAGGLDNTYNAREPIE